MAKKKDKKRRSAEADEDARPRGKRKKRENGDEHDEDKGERIRRLLNELARELIGEAGPLVMGRIEKYLTAFHAGKKRKKRK